MKDSQWFDGAAFINICPVQSGQSFTYRFQVNEIPGTYIWHSHVGASSTDGLAGPLIVRPPKGKQAPVPPPKYDKEYIMFIHDWYHAISGFQAAGINRPFTGPPDWVPDDGNFTWVGNPQAVLINNKGNAGDCTPPNATAPAGSNATCSVVAQPQGGCTHEEFEVEAGKTYLFRMINIGGLTYQTVCFEGHNVTIVAADAVPVDPLLTKCVDINIGQRYDVILTANQAAEAYWISSQSQFRPGSPSGYATLRYKDDAVQPGTLPSTPAPQPGSVDVWTQAFASQITINAAFLTPNSPAKNNSIYDIATMTVPPATSYLMINLSQPVLNETGQIRWAFNNVAFLENPPCNNLQSIMTTNPSWLSTSSALTDAAGTNASSVGLGQQYGAGDTPAVFIANLTSPKIIAANPTAGSHIAPVKLGDVVEIVVQNNAASSFNGGGNRTAQEQHPIHLHGHHFWVMGVGQGVYPGPEAVAASGILNTWNPPLRDTQTLPKFGYIILRFLANNPGTWLLHCHIPYHQIIGQAMAIAEATELVPKAPVGMPKCPSPCTYSAAPYNISYTQQEFGKYIPSPPPPSPVATAQREGGAT